MPRPAHAPVRPPEDDLPRWAALGCLLAPAVLLWRGAPFLTAACVACGLAAVTAASRLLIRRSRRAGRPAPSPAPRRRPRASSPLPAPRSRRADVSSHARAYAPRDAVDSPAG
ncbi:hypothetical protein GA0115245_12215 [Streptomyces sp. di188]|nr:hypothetical protein GA0115238_11714 [Streptomyces sp. di50b]SCE13340.1 hypothetical protein GA0115245_12215 [Streptomyces sp. di188]